MLNFMLTSKQSLVSIIMPVKNASAFLNQTIDSILNQTNTNWELIAIDDHSSDDSLETLNNYSNKYSNIIVLKNQGNGIIDALKTGYNNSIGQFITRMDADDFMSHNKLELMVNALKNGKGNIVTGLVKYFSVDDLGDGYKKYEEWLNGLTQSNQNYSEIYKECTIPSPCWMVCKEDFEKCGGFHSNTYPEDYDLAFRFYQNNLKVIVINQILHYWRDHSNRTSRNHEHYSDNRFLALKTSYFLAIDYNRNKKLVLWGAGKKGKEIAQLLLKQNISFDWICNTDNKIGKEIYSKTMLSNNDYKFNNNQIIIAVANPKEQLKIKKQLNSIENIVYYFFC